MGNGNGEETEEARIGLCLSLCLQKGLIIPFLIYYRQLERIISRLRAAPM